MEQTLSILPARPPSVGERLRAAVQLVRPLNVVMFWFGVALGGVLAAGPGAFVGANGMRLLVAAATASLLGAGANAINDVFDVEIDRINRPDRPLPRGSLSRRAAIRVWAATSALGVAGAFLLSPVHVLIAAVTVGLCFVYSRRLKGVPLLGNLVVAFVTPLALIVYGGLAVGPAGPALVGGAFAFLTTLAREMVKDVEDVVGDGAVAARTLPVVAGAPATLRVVIAVLLATVVLTPGPFLFLGYGSLYLLVVLLADALMLRATWILLAPDAPARAGEASRLLKAAMLAGIAALALA